MEPHIQQLLEYFDPTLVVGKPSYLYDQVAKIATKQLTTNAYKNDFKAALKQSLVQTYGPHWPLNKNVDGSKFLDLMGSWYLAYATSLTGQPELRRIKESEAWYDGKVCRFIGWRSEDAFTGKSVYIANNSGQTIEFQTAEPSRSDETLVAHFGNDLGVIFDSFGRFMYPTHDLDNLFLEQRDHIDITMPKVINKGRVYIAFPLPEKVAEAQYIKLNGFENMTIDKNQKILQFGQGEGDQNIEVASGFVISLKEGAMVNAWVRIENIEPIG